MDILRLLNDVVNRIVAGETTPVTLKYLKEISERLTEQKVEFTIQDDPSNPNRKLISKI